MGKVKALYMNEIEKRETVIEILFEALDTIMDLGDTTSETIARNAIDEITGWDQ